MRKTSSFTPTLLIFFTLVFLSNAFAQGTLFEPRVSLIYFLPKDRPVRPDRITALQALIQDTQAFFADEMERHGYGRKTFTLETNKKGEPVVHQVHGKFNDAYYRLQQEALNDVWAEVKEQFDSPQRIYFTAIDINSEMNVMWCGAAKGYYEERGRAAFMPASGHCFNLPLAAHELGHAFALEHDFRDPAYIMSYGRNRHQLSQCAAVWLDAHVFFNNTSVQVNRNASIQMLSPTTARNGIRLRFEVADTDGLHQAMLYLKPTPADPANDFKLTGCRLLDTESDTIEFVTSELVDPFQDEVTLQVIDKHGSMMRETFPIKFAHLLPPPKYVSLPDRNLVAAVRKALGLGANARITEQTMQRLTELDARNSQIKKLTGLEHATQLRLLELRDNQISDIRPLANLKSLKSLILDDNRVRDINPLANLTQLTWLLLGNNPISDFTPLDNLNQLEGLALWHVNMGDVTVLAKKIKLTHLWLGRGNIRDIIPLANLTQLKLLYLPHNQISDVTPLAGLANLETLHLQDNLIRDISPLVNLTKLTDLKLGENPIADKSPLRTIKDRNPQLKLDIKIPQLSPIVHLKPAQRPPMYWIDAEAGTLHRLVGDAVENMVPSVQNATDLAVDVAGGKLYWTEQIGKRAGKIKRANLDGSNIQTLASLKSVPTRIAINAAKSKLYWTNSLGRIQRSNLNGKQIRTLVKNLESPSNITLDAVGGKLYWTEANGRIHRANLNGKGIQKIANDLGRISDIAIGGNKIYWTETTAENSGKIGNANLNGSNFSTLVRLQRVPSSITTDPIGKKLYWTESNGSIRRANLNGKNVRNVVSGLGEPMGIVLGIAPSAPAAPATVQVFPNTTALYPNYPNPFNPETWIPYQLAKPSDVKITIYDARGVVVRQLKLGHQPTGTYISRNRAAYWDGRNTQGERVASGIYFYQFQIDNISSMRKMLILK